jgi:hypothetical protein
MAWLVATRSGIGWCGFTELPVLKIGEGLGGAGSDWRGAGCCGAKIWGGADRAVGGGAGAEGTFEARDCTVDGGAGAGCIVEGAGGRC